MVGFAVPLQFMRGGLSMTAEQMEVLNKLPDGQYAIVRNDEALKTLCRELVALGFASETSAREFSKTEQKIYFLSAFRRTAKGRRAIPSQ